MHKCGLKYYYYYSLCFHLQSLDQYSYPRCKTIRVIPMAASSDGYIEVPNIDSCADITPMANHGEAKDIPPSDVCVENGHLAIKEL